MPANPTTLAEVIRAHTIRHLALLETAMPGRVTAWDRTAQEATIQPLIQGTRVDAVTEERTHYSLPSVPGVPVFTLGGASGSLSVDLSIGDTGLMIFCSRDLDTWLTSGADPAVPQDPRRHDLTDAVFLPGLRPFSAPLGASGYASGAVVLAGADVRLGASTATDFVALASLVKAELDAIWIKFNLHTHAGVTTGPGVSGLPTDISGGASVVAATKVKAE